MKFKPCMAAALAGALLLAACAGRPPAEPSWQTTLPASGAVLAVAARTGALCAVLAPGGQGLAYALTLPGGDVRELCRRLNAAFQGRGGGKAGFCQGSLPAEADVSAVEEFLRHNC